MASLRFKLWDRVYAPFHGYGTVTKIREYHCVYPIIVTWDKSNASLVENVSSFTEDGYLAVCNKTAETHLTVVKRIHKKKRRNRNEAD